MYALLLTEPGAICPAPPTLAYSADVHSEKRAMATCKVVLSGHQANMVEQLVASGRYQNASEVLREGLRLVEQREAEDASRLEVRQSAVKVRFDDMELGRFTSFDDKDSLRKKLILLTSKVIATA